MTGRTPRGAIAQSENRDQGPFVNFVAFCSNYIIYNIHIFECI
jgi:hypothetical protein